MAKHLAKKAACLIGSAAVALSMTLGAFPVYADSAASAPELGPVTSKDVVYQIITDRFYDGDTSNNVPAGFDSTLYDGTGQDLKLPRRRLGRHHREDTLFKRYGCHGSLDLRSV